MLRSVRVLWSCLASIIGTTIMVLGLISGTRPADLPQACLERIRRAETDPITCEITRQATAAERSSLATWTVGTLLDADCDAVIAIPRQVVEQLRQAAGPVDIPGQRVSCQIVTNGGPLTAVLEVGGRVSFAGGHASDFQPVIEIKQGLPPALGRLLVRFAAEATEVRKGVVGIVNDIIATEPGGSN
jgi:hypothetical protein